MYRLWLTVLGSGYSPIAPGSCGAAVVAAIFFLAGFWGVSAETMLVLMLAIALHGALVTIYFGPRFIARYGNDPSYIVSDEQCGQAVTFLWLWPLAHWQMKELMVFTIAGFFLFRLFDVIKPPPARQLERVKGAWGVLLDDVAAGIYANIVLQVIWYLNWLKPILT